MFLRFINPVFILLSCLQDGQTGTSSSRSVTLLHERFFSKFEGNVNPKEGQINLSQKIVLTSGHLTLRAQIKYVGSRSKSSHIKHSPGDLKIV